MPFTDKATGQQQPNADRIIRLRDALEEKAAQLRDVIDHTNNQGRQTADNNNEEH